MRARGRVVEVEREPRMVGDRRLDDTGYHFRAVIQIDHGMGRCSLIVSHAISKALESALANGQIIPAEVFIEIPPAPAPHVPSAWEEKWCEQ